MSVDQELSHSQGPALDIRPGRGADDRMSIVLLLDTSTSMSKGEQGRRPIDELNAALAEWGPQLMDQADVARSGEIAIVSFGHGGVQVHNLQGTGAQADHRNAFVRVRDFRPPVLEAGGVTPMVEAIRRAITLVTERKRHLRPAVEIRFRPLIWMITDGEPTDHEGRATAEWRSLVPLIEQGHADKSFLFFSIGVGAANERVLRGLAPRSTFIYRDGVPFADLLTLVSASIGAGGAAGIRDADADTIFDEVEVRQNALADFLGLARRG